MGGGTWSSSAYAATETTRDATGSRFAYDTAIRTGKTTAKVHETLDPKKVAGKLSPLAGKLVREARDSVEHPNTVPIIVAFDETGSMGNVPRMLQKKLAELFALLLMKGYVEDPQLCIGAYGDLEIGETAPIQIGQFESDNRADETLDNLYLEGRGGGNRHESAAGIWYYAANYTATDAWEKRGKRGFLFTIGDETTGGVRKENWKTYVDPDCVIQEDLTPEQIVALAIEKWDIYHVIINNGSAKQQNSVKHYTDLLGSQNVIILQDEDAVCETIALAIGLAEGTIDLDTGLDHLDEIGSGAVKGEVSKALSKFVGSGSVTLADAPSGLDTDTPTERL